MDTDKSSRRGMMKFVACIFLLAVGLAGLYFFVLTPGNSGSETMQSPQSGASGNQLR